MNSLEPSSNKSQDRQPPSPKKGPSSKKQQDNMLALEHYAAMIDRYQSDRFSPFQLKEEQLAIHQIRYVDNSHSLLLKDQLKLRKTDCLFSILKSQFNGVEYLYQVFIGPFVLRILVLNLNRNSDDGDEDIFKEQIGSGGFGSVRAVRIGDKSYAIKRIPFKFKLDPTVGYDFQAQTSEQAQLRRCLREFCVFKICSLLGIGPLLTPSGYDLVCFNNCIEFRMELCETISSKQFYLAHEEISLDQMRQDLFVRLAKLHSLHIVHRDIKPDNLLFSPARKAFVFGDFGMSLLVKEGFKEKTMTSFAGTPNFCGEEMKRLLNGERGLVNLYINDLYSLQESLSFFQKNLMEEQSQISRNSMSYNGQNYDDLSDFQNFSIEHSNGSFRSPTDGAYSSTGQSLVNFTTASTQAPKKLATSINHHQAQIIFEVCRKVERKQPLDRGVLVKDIFDRLGQYQSRELVDSLAFEVVTLFFQNKTAAISNGLKEWKHASRHYGPTNEFTIQLMTKIIQAVGKEQDKGSEGIRVSLTQIQKQLLISGEGSRVNRAELMYYRSVGHCMNYNYSLINYIRHQLMIKEKKSQLNPDLVIEEAEFLAKGFLFFCKGREITSRQVQVMHLLVLSYFQDLNITQDFKPICKDLADYCCQFLAMRKALHYEDLYCYVLYCLNYSQSSISEVKKLLQALLAMYEANIQDLKLSTLVSSLCLNISDKYPSYIQTAEEVMLLTLQRMENKGLSDSIFLKLQLMILYNKKQQHPKVIALNNQVAQGIQKHKSSIVQWKYYNIIRLNTIAQSYLQLKDFQQSHTYYLQSLHQLQTQYSQQKVYQLFQVMNNLVFIFFQQKQYEKSEKYLQDIRELLQQTDRQEFALKRIYVYQQIINVKIMRGFKEQDKTVCIEMIGLIAQTVFKYVDPAYIKMYKKLIGALEFKIEADVKHFLQKETLKALSTQQYRLAFKEVYLNTNLQMAKYLIRDLGYSQQGLKYLWNYINFLNNHPYLLTQTDYFVYNLFATILMKCNSYRRAIFFLQGYIFRIPTTYFDVKKRAFSLIYKASTHINDRFARNYYQLVRNNYALLVSRDYGGVVQKEKSTFKRRLMRKWFEKV